MLAENSYPRPFIKQQLSHLRKKQDNTRTQQNSDDQAQDYPKSAYSTTIVVPFLDGITQAIQGVLRPLEIRVVGRPQRWGLVAATEFKGKGWAVRWDRSRVSDQLHGLWRHLHRRDQSNHASSVFRAQFTRKMQTDWPFSRSGSCASRGTQDGFRQPCSPLQNKRLMSRQVKDALWLYSTDKKVNRDQALELNPLWFGAL